MSRTDEVFKPALAGKRIPIISLDNKWYKLMAGVERTPEMQELENKLKELLKRQGKINTDSKALRAKKAKLMEEIVGALGLTNDHWDDKTSILYQGWTTVQSLSAPRLADAELSLFPPDPSGRPMGNGGTGAQECPPMIR